MKDRHGHIKQTVTWTDKEGIFRRFSPFFMNKSEYRSLLNKKRYETET